MPLYEEGIQCHERMLPYVHMTRNLFCPHIIMDECRSGRRIRTAIREYESRVIPNFTTPASGMAGYRTRLTGFQSRVSHEYFIPVRVLFFMRATYIPCDDNRCRPHATQRRVQSLHSLVAIRLDGFNQLMMDLFQCINHACMSCPDRDSNPDHWFRRPNILSN